MSDLSYDVAQAIVSLKQAQDAVADFYRTKNSAYQKTPEGKRELIRLRTKLDLQLETLASFMLEDYGDVAEIMVRCHKQPLKHENSFTHWNFE